MRYLVHPADWIFVIGYGFLSFAKIMSKNIRENISKKLSGKYSQILLDHAKQSVTDAFKTTSKRAIQITVESGDLIGNKIADKIMKFSKISQENKLSMIKKYLKKDMHLQKKDIDEHYWWLMIWD